MPCPSPSNPRLVHVLGRMLWSCFLLVNPLHSLEYWHVSHPQIQNVVNVLCRHHEIIHLSWFHCIIWSNSMSLALRFKIQFMGFVAAMKLCPSLGSIANLNQHCLVYCPQIQNPVHGLRYLHEIMSLSWIHCNPKSTTPCPLPSNPKSSPCVLPPLWNCSPLLDPLHFLEQCHVLRPQTQDPVHMHGRHHVIENHTKAPRFIATTMSKTLKKEKRKEKKTNCWRWGTSEGGGRGGQPCWKLGKKQGGRPGWSPGWRLGGQGRAKSGSVRNSRIFWAELARCLDMCNAHRGIWRDPKISPITGHLQ